MGSVDCWKTVDPEPQNQHYCAQEGSLAVAAG